MNLGDPQNFWSFIHPNNQYFIAYLRKSLGNFRNLEFYQIFLNTWITQNKILGTRFLGVSPPLGQGLPNSSRCEFVLALMNISQRDIVRGCTFKRGERWKILKSVNKWQNSRKTGKNPHFSMFSASSGQGFLPPLSAGDPATLPSSQTEILQLKSLLRLKKFKNIERF